MVVGPAHSRITACSGGFKEVRITENVSGLVLKATSGVSLVHDVVFLGLLFSLSVVLLVEVSDHVVVAID